MELLLFQWIWAINHQKIWQHWFFAVAKVSTYRYCWMSASAEHKCSRCQSGFAEKISNKVRYTFWLIVICLKVRLMIVFRANVLPVLSKINFSNCARCVCFSSCNSNKPDCSYLEYTSPSTLSIALRGFKLLENFASEKEENSLVKDIEPRWRRLKYQRGHWDNVSILW